MKTSKLITILKALDEVETRQFYRYVRAPVFTKSDDVLRLYKYIRKFYPEFDTPKLEREEVYAKLFPKSIYDAPKLRNLMSTLTKILEDYLIYVKCQQDSFEKKKILTQIYGARNIYGLFEKSTNNLLQELEAQPFRDATFFYDNYALQRNFYFHTNTTKHGEGVDIIKKSLLNLQTFHYTERLHAGLDLKNREKMYKETHDFVVDNFQMPEESEKVIHRLLKELIILFETNEEASFFKAKELFQQHIYQITSEDGATILAALLNHAIRQLPKDELELKFTKEAFALYKIGINKKILIQNNIISNTTFFNIIAIGSKLKEFDFVHHFILEQSVFLHKTSRTDIKGLALGFLYYNQAAYEKVIKVLEFYHFSNILYKINAITLLIRTYYQEYEQDSSYYDLVKSKCETFIRFMRREEKKIHPEKQKIYLSFASLLLKIVKQRKLSINNDTAKVELFSLLDSLPSIFAREWIKEKINNL